MLSIHNIHVSVDDKAILKGLDLTLHAGRVTMIMGPNGSGKSTLAHTIMGNPDYTVTQGAMHYNDHDITMWRADERARHGILLSFQNPPSIPGLSLLTFLKETYRALKGPHAILDPSSASFKEKVASVMALVGLDESSMYRSMHEGFSGGEKKRLEMVQLILLEPQFVMLDELDSGLDVDGLRLMEHVITLLRQQNPAISILIISHNPHITDYIAVDHVYVMMDGGIVHDGTTELITTIVSRGYRGI